MGKKIFEGGNIPFALAFKKDPQFYIYEFKEEGNNVWLKYEAIGRGFSIYFTDVNQYNALPKKIKVISGGWYGTNGRWSPQEKYEGVILCENVKFFKQVSVNGKDYSFKVRIPFLSSYKVLTAESADVGIIEIICKKIIPQDGYSINYFDLKKEKWIPMKEL